MRERGRLFRRRMRGLMEGTISWVRRRRGMRADMVVVGMGNSSSRQRKGWSWIRGRESARRMGGRGWWARQMGGRSRRRWRWRGMRRKLGRWGGSARRGEE